MARSAMTHFAAALANWQVVQGLRGQICNAAMAHVRRGAALVVRSFLLGQNIHFVLDKIGPIFLVMIYGRG
jgi:hypothetical protein